MTNFSYKGEASALHRAVSTAARAVPMRSTIPIIRNIWLREQGGKLVVTGSDLDTAITVSTEGDCTGGVTVPAERLKSFLDALDKGADVSLIQDGMMIECVSGRARHKMPILSVDDYPVAIAEKVDGDVSWEFGGKFLGHALKLCGQACAAERNRASLMGTWFFYGPKPSIIGCDGYIAAEISAPTMAEERAGSFAVPSDAISAILPLCAAETICVTVSASAIEFSTEDARVRTKRIEAEPPPFDRVIPHDAVLRATVTKSDFIAAITRGSNVHVNHANGTFSEVALGAGKIAISANGEDGERATDECSCEMHGKAIRFGVATHYLKWAASSIDAEEIDIYAVAFNKPIIMRAAGDQSGLTLFAPRTL